MVGLRALERLTHIDDQRAGQHHLSQSEEGSKQESQAHKRGEDKRIGDGKHIDFHRQEHHQSHRQDGDLEQMVPSIALDEPVAERPQGEDAKSIGAHHHRRLLPCEAKSRQVSRKHTSWRGLYSARDVMCEAPCTSFSTNQTSSLRICASESKVDS